MKRRVGLLVAALLATSPLHPGSVPRAEAADPVEPFTIAVMPDTQKYTESDALAPLIGQQAQWLVDSRDELNTEFAIHLGDLVESWPNVNHWRRVDEQLRPLDVAGLPYAVLPGNHDLDFATGESPYFDEFFPPSRFSGAAWPEGTVYGGYLGDDQFGSDPVDRQSMNNFSLVSAGGMDFVLIQLEFESPQYSIDWAQRVLDAYPDHRAIISTHGFLDLEGKRTTYTIRPDGLGKPSEYVWDNLVFPNCNVFMVLNGHFHDGDDGEARRTDQNACGAPVHQVLSDYQERPNGGNGWLRYYTFDPESDTIQAHTYSPSLATFETDADSSFTLDYDMGESAGEPEVLVPAGAAWRWIFRAAGWPAGWTAGGFDDAGWAVGSAPLGFGAAGVVTDIDVAPPTSNRPRSAQLRHVFSVDDPAALSELVVTTRADDGVVVFVNGTEVGRANLPAGALGAGTYATRAPGTAAAVADPVRFEVPAGLLRAGANTVAVSTHLNYRGTPNVSFDLSLTALRGPAPPEEPAEPPAAPVLSGDADGARGAALSWTQPAGGAVEGYRVLRDGVLVTTLPGTAGDYADSGLQPDTSHVYVVEAVGPAGATASPPVTVRTAGEESGPVTLVPAGAAWRWIYRAAGWPAGWTAGGFDDAGWAVGSAPLGFGAAGVVTDIDVAPPTSNRPRSAQLRHVFSVDDPAALSELVVTTRADDGVVVFVNGTEVGRANLPAGALGAGTYATRAPGTAAAVADPVRFEVPAGLLRAGANTVAVSTHLNYRGTPNVSFDLSLTALRGPAPPEEPGGPPGDPPPGEESGPVTLVPAGAAWRWIYRAAGWPVGWTAGGFDDAGWAVGSAPLGFGAAGVVTDIDVAPPTSNRPRSAQLRHVFSVDDPAALSELVVTTRADDGVVVFVNGTEVGRANLPAGALGAGTYATRAPGTAAAVADPVRFEVPAGLLRAGANTVAVSTHLNYRGTPNVSFDLSLAGVRG